MESDMVYLRSQIGVRTIDRAALFRSAMALAADAGVSPGDYQAARQESPHPAAYDIETVIRYALEAAGCQLYAIDSVVAAPTSEPDMIILDDLVAFSRKA